MNRLQLAALCIICYTETMFGKEYRRYEHTRTNQLFLL